MIRLQKVMADRGVASRRGAEEMISGGRVRVNGELITTLGTRVAEDAHIELDGRLIPAPTAHRYVLLNKPVGIVSTAQDEHGRKTVVDHIGASERLYPVGRLDTDSEGLLLMTNDGTWAQQVLHPRYGHEREYDVAVEGDLIDEALARLQRGIPLEEGVARAVRISVRSRSRARSRVAVVLRTGWKRQVRRMFSAVGVKVTRLVRVRMGPLELGSLRAGEFRDLTKKEIAALTRPSVSSAATAPSVPAARSVRPERARPIAARTAAPRRVAARVSAPRTTSREGGWIATPRVTRRVGSSRARVEGPRRQWSEERGAQAGSPTRPRGSRAAGPSARTAPARAPQWRRSTRAAAGRAAPRRASR